jgi:hypothetical protein
LVPMAKRLEQTSMSVRKCASSQCLKPFMTYL